MSSFGFGGTNAHLVVEEAPAAGAAGFVGEAEAGERGDGEQVLIPLSARSPDALHDLARQTRDVLCDPRRELTLVDVAHTLGARRGHHDHRLVLIVSNRDEAVEALDHFRRGQPHLCSVSGRRLPGRRPGISLRLLRSGGLTGGCGARPAPSGARVPRRGRAARCRPWSPARMVARRRDAGPWNASRDR